MIIENIEHIMMEKGITAYRLEKDTGIKQTTFQGWKRGSQPAADKIELLIQYLKVSANDIFGMEDKKEELTDNETELLEAFRRLPEREQVKEIGRMEEKAERFSNQQEISSTSRTG